MRKRTQTFPPSRKRPAKTTFEPQSPMQWEALATSLRRERDVLRSALQAVSASGETSCGRCVSNADAARFALEQVGGRP